MLTRSQIVALTILAVVGGVLYISRDSLEGAWALTMTAMDIYDPPAPAPPPAPPPPAPVRLTGFGAKFSNSLMTIGDDGVAHAIDPQSLAGVKYWAFYYSASWCGPCRAFTPDLVSFYRDFKPAHPNFELIFVNLDNSQDAMESYMKSDSMPWPAVWHADIDNPDLEAKKYCGQGIPDLVLVDDDGNVLSDTFQNGQYTDPHHVIDDIRATVK